MALRYDEKEKREMLKDWNPICQLVKNGLDRIGRDIPIVPDAAAAELQRKKRRVIL